MRWLFEVEKDVDGGFGVVGAKPMANGVVVDGKLAENVFGVVLKREEILFVPGFVEDLALFYGEAGVDSLFTGGRDSRENKSAHAELSAFLNVHFVGDSVSSVVVGGHGVNLCFKVAALAVGFADGVPGAFESHAVGDSAGLDAEESIKRDAGNDAVAGPLN